MRAAGGQTSTLRKTGWRQDETAPRRWRGMLGKCDVHPSVCPQIVSGAADGANMGERESDERNSDSSLWRSAPEGRTVLVFLLQREERSGKGKAARDREMQTAAV